MLLLAFGVSLGGCTPWFTPSPSPDPEYEPGLFVTPETLTFRTSVLAEVSSTRAFRIVNRTEETVTVRDLTAVLDDPYGVFEVDAVLWSDLSPGDQIEIDVRFTPLQHQGYSGRIAIPNSWGPDLALQLKGQGDAPFLATELGADWETTVHCEGQGTLGLSNLGAERLDLADTSKLDVFEVGVPIPASLKPGESVSVPISFRPVAPGFVVEALTLETNAPGRESWAVPLQGTGLEPIVSEETFHYKAGGGLHLLLLNDDEGPLAENWAPRLEGGLEDFIADLGDRGIDYRIASVSTSTGCPGSALTFGTADMEPAYVASGLAGSLFDPTPGSWATELLQVVSEALSNTTEGACLEGYLDPAMPLHVIVFSDRDSTSIESWEQAVADIRSYTAASLSISVVGGLSCGETPSDYAAAATSTSGVVADGCSSNWMPIWEALADHSAQIETGPTAFALVGKPLVDTIEVYVDGTRTDEWVLEGDEVVALTGVPNDGAEVRVRYVTPDTCP